MPTYEYQCDANGRIVEVHHKIADELKSWGELCERAGIAVDGTDPSTPVKKLISAGFVNTGGSSTREPGCEAPACGAGPCGNGMCGMQ